MRELRERLREHKARARPWNGTGRGRLLFQTQHIQGLLRLCGWSLLLTPTLVAVVALVAVGEGLPLGWACCSSLSGQALALHGGAVILGPLWGRRIIEPLGRLQRAAQDIHEGHYGTNGGPNHFPDSPWSSAPRTSFNRMSETTREHIDALERATITDQLTGGEQPALPVSPRAPGCCGSPCALGPPFSCLMIDIDHFKRVNDQQRPPRGDRFWRT